MPLSSFLFDLEMICLIFVVITDSSSVLGIHGSHTTITQQLEAIATGAPCQQGKYPHNSTNLFRYKLCVVMSELIPSLAKWLHTSGKIGL